MVLAASYAAGPISGGLINPAITIGADLAGAGLDLSRMTERDQAKQEFTGSRSHQKPRCWIWKVPHLCSLSAVYDSGDFRSRLSRDSDVQEDHCCRILTVCGSLGLVLLLQPCCLKPFPAQKEPKVGMFWEEGV